MVGRSGSCVIMRRVEWDANSYSIGQLIALRLCSQAHKLAVRSRENGHHGLTFFGGGDEGGRRSDDYVHPTCRRFSVGDLMENLPSLRLSLTIIAPPMTLRFPFSAYSINSATHNNLSTFDFEAGITSLFPRFCVLPCPRCS